MSEVKHEVLLQAKGIYKNFETSKKDQAVHALTYVDLTLYRGETLALGIGVHGMVKQLKGFGLFHNLACVHDIHIVTDFRHNAHVMGDDQHAHAGFVPQLLHQAQDLGFNCHIKCAKRCWCITRP